MTGPQHTRVFCLEGQHPSSGWVGGASVGAVDMLEPCDLLWRVIADANGNPIGEVAVCAHHIWRRGDSPELAALSSRQIVMTLARDMVR